MKKYIIILVLGLATLLVNGQSSEIFVNYQPAYLLGDYGSFSPRGIDFEVNRFISQDVSVGFVIGWNVFTKKVVGESLEVNGALVTGTQAIYQNFVPLNINAKKYFVKEESDVTPYIGAGIGTTYSERRTDIGIFSLSDNKWLFNVAPEVGVLYDMNSSTSVSFKVKYNYSAKAGDFPSVSYLSFGLGIGLN
jgi:opacity protein-like surface antigen